MVNRLSCTRCKFKWTSTAGKIPNHCPYCGKEGTVMDMESTAAKFLDVEDMLK